MIAAVALFAGCLAGQLAPTPPLAPTQADAAKEQQQMTELGQALSEAGQSTVDRIRAFEQHLKKYPETKQRASIELELAKLSMDSDDKARTILYGEKVLAMGGLDDLKTLDRVTFALAETGNTPGQLQRALEYSKRYERAALEWRKRPPSGGYSVAQYTEEMDRIQARSLALRARATGQLGDMAEAAQLAVQSWKTFPTGEGAREAGSWLAKLGKTNEAIEYYADAFTLDDSRTTPADRARDRAKLGALYAGANGSEKGLGDAILEAYDRTTALVSQHREQMKVRDPNALAANIFDFTLPAVDGKPVALSSLKGKTIVLDFWATWCGPCRVQHPMIQNVKKQLGNAPDLVFLAISTDEEQALVAPFLKEVDWEAANVYFEAGLAVRLNIASIPTVLVIDPAGKISSRMAGFLPDRFEEMLTERISEARGSAGGAK